jgi:hypothetical protein
VHDKNKALDSLCLIVLFIFATGLFCRAEEGAVGRWEGSIQIPDRELTLIVDLAQGKDGAWIGSIIMPGFDVKGKALKDIIVKGSEVSFALATGRGLQATLKGNVGSDGTLAGDFVEAGSTAHFALKRIGPPQVESPPRNTAISKELEGEWQGQFEIYGTPRKVTIKLVNQGDKGAAAEFIVVGRKTTMLPVDLVSQQGTFVTIESHETGISYEGAFNSKSGEIKGTFFQAAIEIPLVLKRAK